MITVETARQTFLDLLASARKPYENLPGTSDIDSAVAAFQLDGWEIVFETAPHNVDANSIVLFQKDGRQALLANVHGPLMVDVP